MGRVEPWLWVGRGGIVFEVSEGGEMVCFTFFRIWYISLSFVSGELYPQYPFGVYVDKSTVNHNQQTIAKKTPEISNLWRIQIGFRLSTNKNIYIHPRSSWTEKRGEGGKIRPARQNQNSFKRWTKYIVKHIFAQVKISTA